MKRPCRITLCLMSRLATPQPSPVSELMLIGTCVLGALFAALLAVVSGRV